MLTYGYNAHKVRKTFLPTAFVFSLLKSVVNLEK